MKKTLTRLTPKEFDNFCELNNIDFCEMVGIGYNEKLIDKRENDNLNKVKRLYTHKINDLYLIEYTNIDTKLIGNEWAICYFLTSNKKDFAKNLY